MDVRGVFSRKADSNGAMDLLRSCAIRYEARSAVYFGWIRSHFFNFCRTSSGSSSDVFSLVGSSGFEVSSASAAFSSAVVSSLFSDSSSLGFGVEARSDCASSPMEKSASNSVGSGSFPEARVRTLVSLSTLRRRVPVGVCVREPDRGLVDPSGRVVEDVGRCCRACSSAILESTASLSRYGRVCQLMTVGPTNLPQTHLPHVHKFIS